MTAVPRDDLLTFRICISVLSTWLVIIATLHLAGCSHQESPSEPAGASTKPSPPEVLSQSAAADGLDNIADLESEPNHNPVDSLEHSPDAVELASIASDALDAGHRELAFETIRRAYQTAPHDPQVCFVMARLLGDRNRFAEAIHLLDQLAVRHPDLQLPVLGQTADWMVKSGSWMEAKSRYTTILDQIPEAILAHRKLAELARRQGRNADAAEHLFNLCRLGAAEPNELQSLLARNCRLPDETLKPIGPIGTAQAEIDRGEWEAAKRRLEPTATKDPDASAKLGRIYATTEDFSALKKWSVNGQSNQHGDAWFAKGVMAAHQDDQITAIKCFAETITLDPTDHLAYSLISKALEKIGQEKMAETTASRAELIKQTQKLGQQISDSNTHADTEVQKLAELLDQLHRPIEALQWRQIRLVQLQSTDELPDSEALRRISELEDQRSRHSHNKDERPTRTFLLCDIDIDALADLHNASPSKPLNDRN